MDGIEQTLDELTEATSEASPGIDSCSASVEVLPDGFKVTKLGAASHIKGRSPEGLARKHMLHILGQPPEMPEAGLAGGTATQATLAKESAAHRFVIYLKSLGQNTQEIARLTGYCEVHVRQILAQPWARQQLVRLLEESDPTQLIPTMLANAAADTVQTLLEIRDDVKQPSSVRAKVCDSLLDRFLGKAVQQVQIKPMRMESEDDAELDQRLKELRDAERDLIGRPKVREAAAVDLTVVA